MAYEGVNNMTIIAELPIEKTAEIVETGVP
jgi:hypothetical protein